MHAMEYGSAIKKKNLPSATTRTDLEGVVMSKSSRNEEDKGQVIALIRGI